MRFCEMCLFPLPPNADPRKIFCDYRCRNRAVYWQDPERMLSRKKEIRQDHPERDIHYRRVAYEKRKAAGTHLEHKKKWEQNNPEKVANMRKAYAEEHREARNARRRELRRELKDARANQDASIEQGE